MIKLGVSVRLNESITCYTLHMQAQRYPEKYIMKQHFSEWSFVAGTRRAICHMKACMQLTFRKGNLRPQPLNSPHKNNQHWSQTHTKEDTTGSAITCSFTCVMRLNWHIAVAHTSGKHVRGHLFIDESAPGFWGDAVEPGRSAWRARLPARRLTLTDIRARTLFAQALCEARIGRNSPDFSPGRTS